MSTDRFNTLTSNTFGFSHLTVLLEQAPIQVRGVNRSLHLVHHSTYYCLKQPRLNSHHQSQIKPNSTGYNKSITKKIKKITWHYSTVKWRVFFTRLDFNLYTFIHRLWQTSINLPEQYNSKTLVSCYEHSLQCYVYS